MTPQALRWRCRRGLLELDLALAAFLAGPYECLDAPERAVFGELLTENDTDIWAWIQGAEPPARYAALLKSFRLNDPRP